MSAIERYCVDAGTEQCPCQLALTGDCLICDRLQGKDGCDCHWDGVCPYTVFVQNGGRIAPVRSTVTADLVDRKEYGEGITVLILAVDRGFAQEAARPGSFVFIRRIDLGTNYDLPVSVLKADEEHGEIHLAVRREGPKSKMLLEGSGAGTGERSMGFGHFLVRGIYRSGLMGGELLHPGYAKGKRILFLTKGIGAAPAILAMEQLRPLIQENRIQARWLADTDKVDLALLTEYGGVVTPESLSLAGPRREARLPEERVQTVLREGRFDVVCLMASDYYVDQLTAMVQRELPEAKIVHTNNAVMCCGEGICGACTELAADGTVIRRCKCRGAVTS